MFSLCDEWDTPPETEQLSAALFGPLQITASTKKPDRVSRRHSGSKTSATESRDRQIKKLKKKAQNSAERADLEPSNRAANKKLNAVSRDKHINNSSIPPTIDTARKTKKRKQSKTSAENPDDGDTLSDFDTLNPFNLNRKHRKRELAKNAKNAFLHSQSPSFEDSTQAADESHSDKSSKRKKESGSTYLEKAEKRLKGSRFRMLNEALYTSTTEEAAELFGDDSDAYVEYHEGYREQISMWPEKPVEKIIQWLKTKPKNWSVADLGCGEALIAASVPQTVHSFDLYALNERVSVCNMTSVPLEDQSVHVAIFCLSLMGTNVVDCLLEARRILKTGGILKIAEVGSRFDSVKQFAHKVERLGFALVSKQISEKNYFVMLEFKKSGDVNKQTLPNVQLKPCIYKRR
ncbi:ribosomal RNA-processing protein 8-like [Paramacrobiotus metropolitanus]|uniref:ribosomal RNA-processing protein 8-like n=1 Tax=Paramacrobiotus metropolitanus TaxID=2943436 RepID=UPI0024462B92|nr:ribosomal RNA-processing protein 8-like [Paramacrobiotus metropolitanus]